MILGIVALVLVYATVVTLYALSGRVGVQQNGSSPAAADTVVELEPRGIAASAREIELLITPSAQSGPLASGDLLTLSEPMTLVVIPARGERQIEVPAEQIIAPVSVTIPFATGAVEGWPFDRYSVEALIVPARPEGDDYVPLDAYFVAHGDVAGWTIQMNIVPPASSDEPPSVNITAYRSVATVAFAIVLLALMIVTPVLVLMVAISAYRGRRKVEATLMSWMGAMLFATIPLRNFFPGAPPIGSWVDYLVVLWVIAGLIGGLAVFAAAWMRWTPAPESAPRW